MLPESEAQRLLSSNGLKLSPIRGSLEAMEVELPSGRADFVIRLEWKGQVWRFAAEYERTATPKQIESAIVQARRLARAEKSLLPMVIAPYLRDEMLDRLLEEEISGIDLSGNAVIVVPGEWLVVLRGKKNQFPTSAPIKAIYEGTSSLVGSVMFSRPEYEAVTEVYEEILRRGGDVSLATVSKVLKGLEEDLMIGREPTIRLLQPERLLDKLAERYRQPKIRGRRAGQAKLDRKVFEALAVNAESAGVRAVGWNEARYVVTATSGEALRIYTTSIDDLLEGIPFTEARRFANVEFVETADQRVFFDARQEDGFFWVSPLQIYLGLASGGKREREIAESLRNDLIALRHT
jgi:hypothetical protein